MVGPFLLWIFCVGITTLVLGYLIKDGYFDEDTSKEGFVDQGAIVFNGCPSDTVSFINSAGDTMCCNGDVSNRACKGTTICSLSPSPPRGLMTCSAWISSERERRANKFCPSNMPYFFGDLTRASTGPRGCSASQASSDGKTPKNTVAASCIIYDSSNDEFSKMDSCLNRKKLAEMRCPTDDARKSIIESGKVQNKTLPALLACSYSPPNNTSPVPVVCYDKDRAVIYMREKLGGDWAAVLKEKGLSLDTMLSLCPTSKNYYVNGGIKSTDVRF